MNSFFEITKYDPKIDSEELLKEQVNNAYEANKLFFGQDVEIKINIIYKREEMNQVQGRKTDDWIVGTARNDQITIFSPEVFDKVSNHSRSDFNFVLTHEITHIFTDKMYGFKFPVWFKEGLAGYVAEQYKQSTINTENVQDFQMLHGYKDWQEHPNYRQAYSFINYIVKNAGKDKLFEFCSKLEEKESYEDFCQKFKENFGDDLDKYKQKWMQKLI
ncbi:MAG: basic secretory protein-like protein [Candidatus Daviesbacteria bacterium]|nr:basic secretory protein-like protein [Candidatus Daviesbacteria bacterium]